jgi:hypothetical protein
MTIAFPITPVLDNFNRANTGPPPSASWTNDLRAAGSPGLAVRTNQVTALSVDSAGASSWWSAKTFRDDNEAYVTFGNAPLDDFELFARGSAFSGGFPQGYLVWWRSSDSTLFLQRYGPGGTGGYANLTGGIVQTLSAGDAVGIRVIGSSVQAWYKPSGGSWSMIASATSTLFTTGGQIGLLVYGIRPTFDDFGGGSLPVEILPTGTIAPTATEPKKAITRGVANGPKGTIAPTGFLAKGKPVGTAGAISSLAGALATVKTAAPLVLPPTVYRDGMDEMLFASLPFNEAQAQLGAPGVEGRLLTATCGWHGTSFDSQRGSFAIVSSDGPLKDMVGERLAITRGDTPQARTVYVYVHTDSDDLVDEISLTRRAFMALGDPALDNIDVSVDVVAAST